ncbi:MAG: LytTR family DNA-binding domain-containing protein [Reichenbachiella sp.]|uniref:LytTR family DNA-binding domain-containing protein n=1 Tax=Reichenbachiella sp. TaxID=2184521 RepID=UPI00296729F4|nr:LytTR family DNA-binding domain-containing protein [Reichenbachiella sp.]MDW3209818.1 LytTR family DNA-binding domain-containing protein [Reichenbachiella sp.]
MGYARERQAFTTIFIIGLVISLVLTVKLAVLNSRYEKPNWDDIYVIWVEYVLFAFAAPVFLKSCRQGGRAKLVLAVLAALSFVFSYLFILTSIDWWVVEQSYSFWSGFEFAILHSGLQVLLVYGLIAVALVLLRVGDTPVSYLKNIKLRDQGLNYVISTDRLIFIEANDNYVNLVTNDGKKHLLRMTLSTLESQLDPLVFQRIHRKFIVNLKAIAFWKADSNGGNLITMIDQTTLKMSKSFRDKIDEITRKR